jgi:hypothetical protein
MGHYIVLLNSDAFLAPDSLLISFQKMEADPTVGRKRVVFPSGPSGSCVGGLSVHLF